MSENKKSESEKLADDKKVDRQKAYKDFQKPRGYYSEILTHLDDFDESYFEYETTKKGPERKRPLTWQIRTDKWAPTLKKLDKCNTYCFLAPAVRWTSYDREKSIVFPVDTFKPRVQMQHDCPPRSLPRNIQIERLRRQYLKKNVKQWLDEVGVDQFELIPANLVQKFYPNEQKFGLFNNMFYLPLELFDDEEYDTKTPEGWMNHGLIDGIRHPMPGEAFLPVAGDRLSRTGGISKMFEWTDVAVTDYDPKTKLFTVVTLDGLQRKHETPRIYTAFKADDPKAFAERVKNAVEFRKKIENQLKYEFYLDCMILTGTYEINENLLDKMFKLGTLNHKMKIKSPESLKILEQEIRLNHKRTMGAKQFELNIKMQPHVYKFIQIPEKEPEPVTRKVGLVFVIPDWKKLFHKAKKYFHWLCLFNIQEGFEAISAVVSECFKAAAMSLFTAQYIKQMTIEEFEAVQTQQTSNVINFLKVAWKNAITQQLRLKLRGVGKGWYDIKTENPEVYDINKIHRIMALTKQRMQGALRELVYLSANTLVNLVETPCLCTLKVQDDFVWGEDLINSQFKPSTQPIFQLTLQLNKDEAFYSTDPVKFGKMLLNIYDNALRQTHEVKMIDPFLLDGLKFAKDLLLSSVGLMEDGICHLRDRMRIAYEKAIIPLIAYAREYDQFVELFNLNIAQYVENYKNEKHTSSEVKEEVSMHYKLKYDLENNIPPNIVIGPFYINCLPLKMFLINKRQELITKLLDMYCAKMKVNIEDLIFEYTKINIHLNEKPSSIEHIFEIKEWMETIPLNMKALEDIQKRYMLEYEVLDYFWYALPQEDFDNKWQAIGWPYKIQKQIEATNEFLMEETARYYTLQVNDENSLHDRIEMFTVQVTNLSAARDANKTHEIAVEIRRLWKQMKEAQEFGLLLNQRQKLFNVPVVPFDALNKLIKEFEPYKNLWLTASDWLKYHDIWMDNPLVNIDGESIERLVNEMYKAMVKSIRVFADIPKVQKVALDIKAQIEQFRPLVPLIQAIRSPGMRERHWEIFKEETGVDIVMSPILTFNNCLELGVAEHAEELLKISENANKEFSIEQALDKMEAEWENNILELTPYKNTGTFIMKVADEYIQLLDDQIVMTQQLSFSPYKDAFAERIEEWEEKLKLTTKVIEEWIELQKQWMYLEPIFTSEDITRQLPVESKKYSSMERTWRRIMRQAHDNPQIMNFCPDKKLYESLRDANHLLQIVQKGLAEYLEMKRNIFPRLYFLSDDELLEILSQAKNPLAVQPHLRKCFENIARLEFQPDLLITHMYSAEDECVEMNPTVRPLGGVENWLVLVESSMKNTIRVVFGESMTDMPKKTRKEWVLDWPGQIVIAGCQTYWTAEVEAAILRKDLAGFFVVLLDNLDQLRSLVRGILTFLQREVLSALIVIEVHARDVTQDLINEKVKNINDFEWIKQLRYYWIEEELKVRAVNAEFSYGYEYLGNSGRLVITPLTDRCYLTLTGALHLKFGGAPAGPAGTGKTETTKDLAKAFAIQCVVFNCSDQLDFMAMGKFFKGLASSGAWACFDEFNRIDIEVLSVVAQQITTIQKAQQARMDRFMFEGVELVLKPSCAVFITMNPGYAGRTELPDNLKALFRPVAMMVPNYTLIAEISLFSFGFSNAKNLAEKITTTFKLSSEQLSSQDHYDFGMRAVKTVIAVAGNLKREKPDMEEPQIVLRALRDVNVPKFLKDDLKLFNGIISDLFPRMAEQAIDYGILEKAIRESIRNFGLEDVDEYVKKVIQLYETTVVRHGLMLVGPTGSGKTKCYEVLKDAMTNLKGKPQPSGYPFEKCHTYVLNPKSITMGQLYGEFDLATHEWTDGILPCLVRIGVAAENKDKRWYVFDGPVDAVWIENMNTVLDDNKKLCLSSGEIIKLLDTQRMIFEVADLAVASPATVSRCGMVYLEPANLGLQPFLNCWVKRLPDIGKQYGERFHELFEIYLLPAIDLLRAKMKEIVASVDSAIVQSFLYLLDFRIGPLTGRDNKPIPALNLLELIPNLLVPWVVFSLIWSVGATCDYGSRVIFSDWVRKVMSENKHEPKFPTKGLVYDYNLHDGGFTDFIGDNDPMPPTWFNWMKNIPDYVISADMKYSDIEVPTIDNIRNAELIGLLLGNENNVLCIGPTGTGKTLTVIGKLSRNMPKKFICDYITFSARTSANQTQDLIDSKLDRRRKGTFGPPLLKKQIFFIDDFNMPALEVYGAQPPIELIRQFMDFKGWYDRKNVGEWRTIIDTNFVGAMGPPGGGRNPVTARLLRHFHYLAFTEMEDDSKLKIFGAILMSWLVRTPELNSIYDVMVTSTLEVYKTILAELLPTPAKTHYTFNLRDLSKVFQGVLMTTAEKMTELKMVLRLWYHENCRVYQDRLVNDEDRKWFESLLREKIRDNFNEDDKEMIGEEKILFGDFMDPSSDLKEYEEIADFDKLTDVLTQYLEDYNLASTNPMKLVLFLDAVEHVSRISRILRQPMGNALLLGMGGSGRRSLTKLATHMAEYYCFQIELSKTYGMYEWREDVKNLMLKTGLYSQETTFIFSDTQIKSAGFLEDLNNMLNSGDVPNIYQPDELDKIYQNVRTLVVEMGLTPTKSNLFAVYTKQVRSNLHIVITMSPIGEIFRARLRQFPALVNCCTIDWFSAWPESALQSVALQFLEEVPELAYDKQILMGIVNTCRVMHASVVAASDKFLQELSRHNYVTPTSYLELLKGYTELIKKKKGDIIKGIDRLKSGMEKLIATGEEVKVLQEKLKELKPLLEIAAADAEVMIKKIAADTEVAEATRMVVEKEEREANLQKLECEKIAQEAQKDLDEAMPALLAAEKSLKELNKNDITEVKAMKKPPVGVIYVVEAICIVKGIKPNKVPGQKIGEKIDDYWEPGRQMFQDPGAFLTSLINFKKETITENMINSLRRYVKDPSFQPEKIATVSKACESLCMWVHAMYEFYFVNLIVAPKKEALEQAQKELEITEKKLAATKENMQRILDGLAVLNEQLRTKIEFKEDQERGIRLCEERMNRAVRLVSLLADERVRWMETIDNFNKSLVYVVGDIMICSGAVAYLTPFTDSYRSRLMEEWIAYLGTQGVPYTENCDVISILGEPVVIRKWQLDGLPRDSLSTENAILVFNSRRWPLFIDPQGQANKWVRNTGRDMGINICKLADKDLIRTLESAIRFGKAVLIENVGTDLDPALDPVLTKALFKQNNQIMLKLGDNIIPYNDDFRLFITTKLANPHYTPEVSIKVLLVNFALTTSGLTDQLLALVVMQERPDLEEMRSALVVSSAQMKGELKDIEDRILHKLSASEGSPVDDIDLIVTLEASKIKSEEIKLKVASAEVTQADIDNTRALYIPVANRSQILFFCLADLSNIDPMYQYSLEWFVAIFIGSMANTEKSDDIDKRIGTINDHFTFSLFSNVCRSLFEKHKLLFAFLLCVRILMDRGDIDPKEWHFLLAGGSPLKEVPNPDPSYLKVRMWSEVLACENLPKFQNFVKTFKKYVQDYKKIVDSLTPQTAKLPAEIDKEFTNFQKMIVLKCLRPDKFTDAMQLFLVENMGQRFIEPQSTELSAMFGDSGPTIPLIFVLSAGTDPAADLYKFADKMRMGKRMAVISLGQGQGPRAEKMIDEGVEAGLWVFFQNCHLAPSFMPRLERLLENIPIDTVHRDFRLWLTSTPSPHFPVSILQNGSKMTVEPPRGIKANLLRAYMNQLTDLSDFFHSEGEKVPTFKFLLFSLCVFHACLLERRKFGPLGFNIPYEFTDGDLRICISQLHMFLMEYNVVPYKVLTYTAGQINYGGRVTDDWDRRCLMNILDDYYKPAVLKEKYAYDAQKKYHQMPSASTLYEYLEYLRTLPINDDPGLFGLHLNADISCAQALTYNCLQTLLMLQPKQIGEASASAEDVTASIARGILEQVPKIRTLEEVTEKYPVMYEESLNTVLSQEVIRFTKLLNAIKGTLQDLLKALKGLVVMSDALERMSNSLFSNQVPEIWAAKAYPSLKPLGSWVTDLQARVKFLETWYKKGIPPVFWISGFYFPQAFLTGTLQNFARKYIVSIDTINFRFEILDYFPTERPEDGCCIHGLFLEGARWNKQTKVLDESLPKELYTEMPVVWMVPEEFHKKKAGLYECPVYKTLTRAGTLSTTGHSTNYVIALEIPSKKPESHWIKRGCACLCALDY